MRDLASPRPKNSADPLQVVWFKRDLRIDDHCPLTEAARRGPVLPLYIVEPALWRELDMSGRQWMFVRESLGELDAALGRLGQPLVVRVGDAVDVLDDIRRAHGIAALWSHEETGNAWTFKRDRAVGAWARRHGILWHEPRQFGIVRRLASRNGWAKAWDRQMAEPVTLPPSALAPLAGIAIDRLPEAGDLGLAPDPCPGRQRGGREAGLDLLYSFLHQRGEPYRRAMSSPLTGAAACSRLSPHLAWGTVSMREVAQATWTRMREAKSDPDVQGTMWRGSLHSFAGRLHWHCHFMQKLESEPAIEHREFHPATRGLRPEPGDRRLLEAWSQGETGYPFLDACMRSLDATGWLNFRMRAMVMSFASYNLWLPWRETGLHLARQFTDYEPGIHWPQTQMQSGTTGINTIRIYSVVKQGHDQDPTGAFVRRWVPELGPVPDRHLQEPWTWGGHASLLGRTYPERIVDLADSTKAAKDRIYGLRKGSAFHQAADAIQEKHGSRKSGMPMTGAKRKAKAKPRAKKDPTQTELDL
jgi:deoxyribodipyrimidine photo-lyase